MTDETSTPSVTIRHVDGFQFLVDFGAAFPDLATDEPEPVGRETGPSPEQMLIAGVCNCLCASLVFALGKFHQNRDGITARAAAQVVRNAEQRLRVGAIDVRIDLGSTVVELPRIARVLEQFEAFCTVSESVKAGIPVNVEVFDADETRLR